MLSTYALYQLFVSGYLHYRNANSARKEASLDDVTRSFAFFHRKRFQYANTVHKDGEGIGKLRCLK